MYVRPIPIIRSPAVGTPQLGFLQFLIPAIASIAGSAMSSSASKAASAAGAKAAMSKYEAEVEIAKENSPVRYVEALFDQKNLYWQEELDRMAYRSDALTQVVNETQVAQVRSSQATATSAKTGLTAAGLVAAALLGVVLLAKGRR